MPSSFAPAPGAACPRAALHTKMPEGYTQRARWAAQKAKTHTVRRCPGCGAWAIYVRRPGI